jgi:hypothetical protein
MKCISTGVVLSLLLCLGVASLRAAPLELDAATQKRLGIRTEALRAGSGAETSEGVAQVLDPVPLIRLSADLSVAAAAANASGAEAARLARLHDDDGNVSLRAVEAARATSTADAAKLAALLAELRGTWGSAPIMVSDRERNQLMASLASGTTVLLRVETLAAAAGAPRVAQLVMVDQSFRRVDILGPLPQAGSGAATAWLGRATGAGLAAGMARSLNVEATGRHNGVLVPRNAIVRWNGLNWVYVAMAENRFTRRALTGGQPHSDGWLLTVGFEAGEQVVVQGAGALLAAETLAGEAEGN